MARQRSVWLAALAGLGIARARVELDGPEPPEPRAGSTIEYVDLIAPTSSDDRVALLTKNAGGFLYLVSVTGVTGARASLSESLPAFVARVYEDPAAATRGCDLTDGYIRINADYTT